MTCMAFKIQITCLMNELIVHNTQSLCRTELGFAIICGIRDIAQTWTNTEPNCSRLPKLCKTVSVIFLYMWHASRKLQVGEKSKHFKYFVIIYWQYPVGALFWQTAFWLMPKICTNSLILFLFLKREFRLVSKTKVYLHGYKIWSHTALSRLLNFFLLELKLRLKIIIVQCSLH